MDFTCKKWREKIQTINNSIFIKNHYKRHIISWRLIKNTYSNEKIFFCTIFDYNDIFDTYTFAPI
jgi:hypothetical protein